MKATVRRVVHPGWPQFSIICTIGGADLDQDAASSAQKIILTSHLDSITSFAPLFMPAPGADDDGSGVVTQLEVLRVLVQDAVPLARPVEFMFFAAEEGGLLGSQGVVRHYLKNNVSAALLHIDMDGYSRRGRPAGIGLITDNTDAGVNAFIKRLAKRYSSLPVKETACGYACSDHYSWHVGGYPVGALFEGTFDEQSPHIHTERDRVDTIDFDHMREFAKVSLAFALHLADRAL